MIAVSSELATLLEAARADNASVFLADLFTITTTGGQVYRFTSAAQNLHWSGETFEGFDLIISRSEVKRAIGITVDSLEVSIFATENEKLNGVPFIQALHQGLLDGAELKLQRAFLNSYYAPIVGVIDLFTGNISESNYSRFEANLSVKSELERLNIKMPRNLWQAGCMNTLFDSQCALSKNSFSTACTALAGGTAQLIVSDCTQVSGFFDLGTITILTGANAGERRTVKQQVSGNFLLMLPLPFALAVSDTFSAFAGCDKTMATCQAKFNNIINFRGMPFVPTAETAT